MPSAVVRLQVERMSQTMSEGGFSSTVKRLLHPGEFTEHAKAAKQWVDEAIAVVRTAPDFASLGVTTDEEIAALILKRLDEKKQANKAASRSA